ncbi:MAG: serine hydrolase domain-containing protein, partial [Bacteroidota bacterium]
MIKKLFSFLLFVSLSINANSQTFDPVLANELQNKIDSIRIANNIKGISVSVVYPGMGTWNGVSGVSHIGTPITSDMLFGIASNTKLFTGVLLLKLAESNFISLDDSLYEYLPTFNNIDSTITIRQLLNHTSGLDDVTSVPGYPDSMLTDPNRIFTASELITWAGPPQFAAGTSWSYCNTNYLLAGMIAESVTGISYSQLLRDSILTPLQLDSTFLDVYEPILYPVAQPWQGGFNNNAIPRTSVNSAAWAAGAMYSTSGEMVQWYNALMHGLVLNTNSFNEMTTFVGSGNYGIGIGQATVIGRTVWTHGGSIWGGYSSNMMYDPSTGIIICVLINQFPAPAFQVS